MKNNPRRAVGWLKDHRFEFLLFFVYLLLTIAVTYPLIIKMCSAIYGDPGDGLGTIWFFWWQKYAIAKGLAVNNIKLLGAPFGLDWSNVPKIPLVYYPALLLTYLANELFAYNFLVLITFPVSAMAMYALVKHVTGNRTASAVAGLIYGFSPVHFAHSSGHLGNIMALMWLPLLVLALLRLKERRSFGAAVVFGGCFALVVLTDYYLAYFMLFFIALFVLYALVFQMVVDKKDWLRKQGRILLLILLGLLISAVIIAPFTLHVVKTATAAPSTYARAYGELNIFSARPWEYVLPAASNPILGKLTSSFIKTHIHGSNLAEQTLYLGVVPLILAITAFCVYVIKRKKLDIAENKTYVTGLFGFAALVVAVLSGPSFIDVGRFRIPLFSSLAYKFLPMFRVYARFGVVVMLCVAVLAGLGLAYLLTRFSKVNWRNAMVIGIIVIIAFEFTYIPPVTDYGKTPPEYTWLSRQPGDFIIAEYPLKQLIYTEHYEYMFYQRIHGKRLFNGSFLETEGEAYRALSEDLSNERSASILGYLGVKYAVVHWDNYKDRRPRKVAAGFWLVRSFADGTSVYAIKAQPPETLLLPVSGFGNSEKWPDGRTWRWIGDSANLTIVNPVEKAQTGTIRATVASFGKTRKLKVIKGGKTIDTINVSVGNRDISINGIRLNPGENNIVFKTDPGAEVTDSMLHNEDFRAVSIVFSDLRVEVASPKSP